MSSHNDSDTPRPDVLSRDTLASDSREVTLDIRRGTANIQINREYAANSLTPQTSVDLADAFLAAERNPEVRVIVVRGAGSKAFCAGVDLKQMAGEYVHPMKQARRNVHEVILEIEKPTIAAINGAAVGAGCEIALACDLRVAASGVRMGQTEAKVGMGGNFGTVMLTQMLPRAIALELLYTGRLFSAEDAFQWGLVNKVVDASDLDSAVSELAMTIAQNAPLTIQKMKATAIRSFGLPLAAGLRLNVGPDPYSSEDRIEGALAFKEKRAPNFKGR